MKKVFKEHETLYKNILQKCYVDSNYLEQLPEYLISYELCLALAEYYGFVLADTPTHFRDYNLCRVASINNSIDEGVAYNTHECYWALIKDVNLCLLINTL